MIADLVHASKQPARWFVIAAFAVAGVTGAAEAQELPSNMQIVGTISASSDGTAPANGDQVIVVKNGATQASGTVVDASGAYFVEMSKTQAYNGTTLSLRLRKSSGIYQLEFGPDNQFSYNGGFPFPARTTISPTIGSKLSGGDGDGGRGDNGGDNGGGYAEGYDVNEDGVFNQADIDLIKQIIIAGTNDSRADIDKSGIVNTRDAILAIRALTDHRHNHTTKAGSNEPDKGDEGEDDDGSQNGDQTETAQK
jgi:hypothetical protein